MKDWRIAVAAVVATAAVAGAAQAITDHAFNYSSPQPGFLSINPVALTPDASTMNYERDPDGISLGSASAKCFGIGLNLPEGARIMRLDVWYQSDAVGADPEFFIERQRKRFAPREIVALVVGADDSGTRKVGTAAADSSVAVVDNFAHTYAFRTCLSTTGNVFHSARIRYTYTNAGD